MRSLTESLRYIDLSNGSSADFNKLIRSISSDIVTVFNMANQSEEAAKKNLSIITQENLFLQRRIKELEEKLTSIEKTISARANNREGYSALCKTFYTADDIEYISDHIYHDATYGIITLPHSNINKIPFSKYPRDFLKKNIDIITKINGTAYNVANDPDLINIIDGDDSTFWVKVIETGSDTDYIDFSVTINMPLRIMSSLTVNSIGIKPHPVYSMTLTDITYTGTNGTEYRIPTYPVDKNEDPLPIQAIDNVKFMFPVIEATSLTFNLRQPYYIQNNDKRLFVIGFRGIDIESISITREEASFITAFRIPADNKYFARVLEPVTMTLNDEDYSDAITHELYYDRTGVAPFPFNSDISADINTIYIKTTLRHTGEIIPAIRGIEIRYMAR